MQAWMPSILALFGSLLVVVVTAWLNMKALSSQIDAVRTEFRAHMNVLRAEMRQGFAEFRLEVRTEITELRVEMHAEFAELRGRVERIEEQRGGLVRP